jgi:quercetin dioxygenase-like cupin family protein
VEAKPVEMDGAEDVTIQVLIGPDDGSENMVMRLFRLATGGQTPYHQHDWEHVVKVLSGKGVVIDDDGNEHELSPGYSVYVAPNEKHGFANRNAEPFEMTCTILNLDRK